MTRVVITGLGCVTPIGSTVESFAANLFAGVTGIAPFSELFPTPPTPHSGLRFTQMAEVRDFDPAHHLDSGQIAVTERSAQFALVAARQAATDSGLRPHYAPEAVGIVFGCASGGRRAEEFESAKLYTANARVHPFTVPRTMSSSGASQVSIDLGITGPALTVSTACASGTHAIGLAFHMVRSGLLQAAVAGGHEAPLTFGFLRAWDSMRVVSPTWCRPFAADRDGMTLGEGAAMLALETLDAALARNAPIYAEIAGFGMSSDAHHITQPDPGGAAAAIRACLRDAAFSPADIDYINAHGTGTQVNDQVEAAAIHTVFGGRASRIPTGSTKGHHGHAIGASGAIEALATALALHRRQLPPTAGTQVADPSLNLNVILGTAVPVAATPFCALSNSLAFGGLNAVLALRSWPS